MFMLVIKIEPQGYCNGVKNALDTLYKALNDPSTKKPIYLLSPIIHNTHVNDDLKKLGVIVLDGKNRLDLLDDINFGSVVFSAHGVSDSVYNMAKTKNLNIIDTTCPNVKIIHDNIKKRLNI